MAEPKKKKKRDFESQTYPALKGLQVLTQSTARAEASPEKPPASRGGRAPEATLVARLIEYIKSMD